MRKGFWHWKWQITFKLLFSNLLWRFAEVFHAEFSTVVQLENCSRYPLLQLKALSLCEGCHYQRSWHVELRFGRPESHLRWALKTADFGKGEVSFLGTGESLHIEENWPIWWCEPMETFQIPCLWTCFLCHVRFLTLVRILERISRTWGVCWPFYSRHGVMDPFEGPQLPLERPVATWDGHFHWEALWILSAWTWVFRGFGKAFPYFLSCNFQIKRWESSWKSGKTWCQFHGVTLALGRKTDALSTFEISQVWLLILLYLIDNLIWFVRYLDNI